MVNLIYNIRNPPFSPCAPRLSSMCVSCVLYSLHSLFTLKLPILIFSWIPVEAWFQWLPSGIGNEGFEVRSINPRLKIMEIWWFGADLCFQVPPMSILMCWKLKLKNFGGWECIKWMGREVIAIINMFSVINGEVHEFGKPNRFFFSFGMFWD